jgi:hypothetical protein
MKKYVFVFLVGVILGGVLMLLPGMRYRYEVHKAGNWLLLYRFDRINSETHCSIPNGPWIPLGVVRDFDPDAYLAER